MSRRVLTLMKGVPFETILGKGKNVGIPNFLDFTHCLTSFNPFPAVQVF